LLLPLQGTKITADTEFPALPVMVRRLVWANV
jgi:hypothetical protein